MLSSLLLVSRGPSKVALTGEKVTPAEVRMNEIKPNKPVLVHQTNLLHLMGSYSTYSISEYLR